MKFGEQTIRIRRSTGVLRWPRFTTQILTLLDDLLEVVALLAVPLAQSSHNMRSPHLLLRRHTILMCFPRNLLLGAPHSGFPMLGFGSRFQDSWRHLGLVACSHRVWAWHGRYKTAALNRIIVFNSGGSICDYCYSIQLFIRGGPRATA